MSGGGGGKSSSTTSSPFAATAAQIAQKQFQESDPLRTQFFSTIQEMLSTGGIGPGQTPIAQNAVTNARQATDSSIQTARNQFARLGLGKDPASQGILAGLAMKGNQQVSQIPTDIAMQFIGMGPGLITGTGANVNQALGTAVSGSTRTDTTTGFNPQEMFQSLFQAGAAAAPFFATT